MSLQTVERGHGLLFSQLEPPPGSEVEFHDWYDHEHIPGRLQLRGFSAARRYIARSGSPRFLTVYELADLDVLNSDAYRQLKHNPSPRTSRMLSTAKGFTRFVCAQVSDTGACPPAPWLSVVAFSVPDDDEPIFNWWYDREHVPALMSSALWQRVRRFRVTDGEGGPWTHLALHELTSETAIAAPERDLASQTPLCDKLASRPWFLASRSWLYELISNSLEVQ